MRDSHDGMPEIVDAYERDGHFFGVVQVLVDGVVHAFEFGVSEAGLRSLRSALALRPFDTLDRNPHRYFFTGSAGFVGSDRSRSRWSVRVEGGRDGRNLEVEGPSELVQNLRWFMRLKRLEDAKQLREVGPRPEV